MKIVNLNTWGCKVPEIFDYIGSQSSSTDVFCFQEILKGGEGKTEKDEAKDSFERIVSILPNHVGYFVEYGDGGYYSQPKDSLDFQYGLACFVKEGIDSEDLGGTELYSLEKKWSDYSDRFAAGGMQVTRVDDFVILNVHGMWQRNKKIDSEARFEQLRIINDFADKHVGRKILCGDFNVTSNTKFVRILEEKYRNVLKEFDIRKTRSDLYDGPLDEADYVFVDHDVRVDDCYTVDANISDHLPTVIKID